MLGLTYILTDYKIYIYRKNNKKMVDFYLKKSQNTIPVPLHQAIDTNYTVVQQLHLKLNDLRVLFAVDVRSILSITITSTDNDGD